MRKYKEALESKGLSRYRAAQELGCTRQYLGDVLNGTIGAGKAFEERWMRTYGELPEDDGIVRERSASPRVIKERVPAVIDVAACMGTLENGVASRIKKAYENKPLPQNTEELVNLMVGSWRTGVLDAGKFFASANADKKDI